ncbi:hypothetical protein BDZ89DRAFT_972572 [Hymenopellis radicata]|nr:hypothetical protein BDZ89DRAFT_972572 [Hymenopellis radicata]
MSDTENPPPVVKPNVDEEANAPISVKVGYPTEVFFKIRRSTKLAKLQGGYANKVGKGMASIRWVPRFPSLDSG